MVCTIPLLSASLVTSFSTPPSEGAAEEAFRVIENEIFELYCRIGLDEAGLSAEAFTHALIGYYNLKADGKLNDESLLTIIDFTQSCNSKRFYTVNLQTWELVFHEWVAHGENTGKEYAEQFSNRNNSHQSSLGFFVTGEIYYGKRGYSLRLDGMELGINDKVRMRGVVIHAADYVDESLIEKGELIGTSWGCPALREEINREVIETLKEGTCVFAWYNDNTYLRNSRWLDALKAVELLAADRLARSD